MDGWIAGQPWGYEVVVPASFDYLLADRSRQMTLRQWESLGVRRAGGGSFREPDARAYLLLPAGARGPAFLNVAAYCTSNSRPRAIRSSLTNASR